MVGGIGERTMEFISMENIDSMATEVVRLVDQLDTSIYEKGSGE